jgi:hypothetical protein
VLEQERAQVKKRPTALPERLGAPPGPSLTGVRDRALNILSLRARGLANDTPSIRAVDLQYLVAQRLNHPADQVPAIGYAVRHLEPR